MGCGVSRFDPEGTAGPHPCEPIDPNATISPGGGAIKTASGGRRSVSSLVQGRRFLKRVANASIDEGKEGAHLQGVEMPPLSDINDREYDDDDRVVREDSILMGPGSPSFRVYCDGHLPHHHASGTPHDHADDAGDHRDTEANYIAPPNDSKKGEERQVARKGKARGFRSVLLRRGGPAAGMKRFLSASTFTSHEQAVHANRTTPRIN